MKVNLKYLYPKYGIKKTTIVKLVLVGSKCTNNAERIKKYLENEFLIFYNF
jgi:hypothetical protein